MWPENSQFRATVRVCESSQYIFDRYTDTKKQTYSRNAREASPSLRHWLAVIANRNHAFSIRHKGTHHQMFVPSRRMSHILTYVRLALATSDVHKKYRQLMRSTWRIETMVLPELSRTMAYKTRNTVNRLQRLARQNEQKEE